MSTCYMCDLPETGREHVPPKSLFPRGHRNELITVPSCDVHNNRKSGDDEVVAYLLGFTPGNNNLARKRIATLIRAVKRSPGLGFAIFRNMKPAYFMGSETYATEVDRERFDRVMDCMARGLIFDKLARKYLGPLIVDSSALFFGPETPGARDRNAGLQSIRSFGNKVLGAFPFSGGNPEVFKYKLLFEIPDQVLVKMVFFEGTEVMVFSGSDGSR